MRDLPNSVPAELTDFYFDADDRLQMDGCITALTRDGLNVAVMSAHSAALEHYGALLINRLRKFTPTSKVEVYFPASPDDLLARFNQSLANQSLAQAMQERKNILATQFWVLNNAASLPEHELNLLASLVQNFPGANIRLILFLNTSRKPNQVLDAFGKNILRWEIALPDAEQKENLLAQAKGSAQLKAVRTLLNRLSNSASPSNIQSAAKKSFFKNPFAKVQRSSAKKARNWTWLKWTASAAGLLVCSAGAVAWLYPSSFSFLNSSAEPAVVQAEPEKKSAASSVKGKTSDTPKSAKNSEKTSEPKVDVPKSTAPAQTAAQTNAQVADLVDELPNEAAAGQAWLKQLPAGTYLVRHFGLPVFKSVSNWQQTHANLKNGHIVATYKPGDKLAQFVLVSGPYKTRSEAMEVTRQSQTPRFAYPITSDALAERLTPRPTTTTEKPKETRR
jgi:hypothetical protein